MLKSGTIPSKKWCVFVCMTFCVASIFALYYFSQESRISYQSFSSEQVAFLYDTNNTHASMTEGTPLRRQSDLDKIQRHMFYKVTEDYRFCRKEAPFVGPFQYTPKSKNPCWRNKKGQLQCIPYFFQVGFSKCGTTDLFDRITRHKDVIGPRKKELHWLDFYRYFEDKDDISYYAKFFSTTATKVEKDIQSKGNSQLVTGDGTPLYAWDSRYWPCYEGNRGLSEPKYTNADVIYRLNPNAKIIMLLRDPVTRLYSWYMTWINKVNDTTYINPTEHKFHQNAARSIDLYTQCFKEWSPRHCAYNGTISTPALSRLQEGLYSIYIADWLKVFPRDQILILKFEDYSKDLRNYLKKGVQVSSIANPRFLKQTKRQLVELVIMESQRALIIRRPISGQQAAMSKTDLDKAAHTRWSNKGRHYSDVEPMSGEMKTLLQEFYAPFNRQLQTLLDDDSFSWGYE